VNPWLIAFGVSVCVVFLLIVVWERVRKVYGNQGADDPIVSFIIIACAAALFSLGGVFGVLFPGGSK